MELEPVPEVIGAQILQWLAIKKQCPILVQRKDGTTYWYNYDVHKMEQTAGESNVKNLQKKSYII
jgi:hypothetical protein